jgi:hypothetical protein
MWFMPSYGRPQRLRELLAAPGGWPERVTVLVNRDDPELMRYQQVVDALTHAGLLHPWWLHPIPRGSRCADAHRYITETWRSEHYYGLLCDDQWPITPGWYDALVEAAGSIGIATPAGEPAFPKLRNALVIGGELARLMGSLVPAPVKHNYEDNIWDRIAADFNLLRPCPEIIVEHRHWVHGTAAKDATYERGSADADADRRIFEDWLGSDDRARMNARIADALGIAIGQINPQDIRLAIICPIQNEQVDVAYHKSLNATLVFLARSGIDVNVIEAAGGSNVGKARERVLWEAMRRKPTHLLFVDADMGWEPELVRRLLCSGHEFCAVPGAKKQKEARLCVNFLPAQEFHPHTGFLKVRDIGFAFVLLQAGVIDKLCEAYPELAYNAGPNREWALFLEMIDKNDTANGPLGERLSEDLSFCRRWRAIGGDIWADHQSAVIHAGRMEYSGRIADLFEYEKPKLEAA